MDDKITVIGIGKLGLCFALALEKQGYEVVGVDINPEYIDKLNDKSFITEEPKIQNYLKQSKNFIATTDIVKGLDHAKLIFLFVATPSLNNGRYDHSQIDRVVDQIIKIKKSSEEKYLMIGCTTMPGYSEIVQKKLIQLGYIVSYTPEFIAQGSIIDDLINPDILLIGEGNKLAGSLITEVYSSILQNQPSIHRMSLKEAEITKIALNCFLTTKIAYANMVGDIAISAGCDPDIILDAIGGDSRIGNNNLKYGFGFGGPCFPRDNRAFALFAKDMNIDATLSRSSDIANKLHLQFQIDNFIKKNNITKPVVISKLSYKLGTNIIEESQKLAFAVEIARKGYEVTIEDKETVIILIKEKYADLFNYKIS